MVALVSLLALLRGEELVPAEGNLIAVVFAGSLVSAALVSHDPRFSFNSCQEKLYMHHYNVWLIDILVTN